MLAIFAWKDGLVEEVRSSTMRAMAFATQVQHQDLLLDYDRPAREAITEGLPLGNGHLGALILGGPACDRWVLNEATLYRGGPYDPTNPDALTALPKVRELIFAGEYEAATELAEQHMMAKPMWQAPYQPLGDLFIEFAGHERYRNYRRQLDLDRAVVSVSYEFEALRFVRDIFVSAADQVLVARLSASEPGSLSCVLRLASEQLGMFEWQKGAERWYSQRSFGMRGKNHPACGVEGALVFEFGVELRAQGGRVLPGEDLVSVRDGDELVLVAAAATNYVRFDDLSQDPRAVVQQRLAAVSARSYTQLYERHVEEHQRYFRRFSISLGTASNASDKPTDQRIAEFARGEDPGLAALYVQYARYLLLGASRSTSQPANLQGIWNDKLDPPWGSKCTININTEMNYWPAQAAALPECVEPLFSLLEDLSRSGKRTAREHYAANGWVAHHNVDLWRATGPVDGALWGLWPMGGAWLCLHLWDAYLHTADLGQLERAYPILKGACEFFLDFLVEHPVLGYLVTCPTTSPENHHPQGSTLCAGPTMDNAILRDLFSATAKAAVILERDAALGERLLACRERLAPYRVGGGGQLQEWLDDWDREAPELSHRHVSHLFGVFPSSQIGVHDTPELARAAKRSLELRGDAATGWSLAWKVNLWARLGEAERALELLTLLLSPDRSYTNLFDAHPPFQIDGNFGGASGILEMLVQSQPGRLHVLPALPGAWSEGSVRGLRARQALTLDMAWQAGELETLELRSGVDQTLELRVSARPPRSVVLSAGQRQVIEL